MWEWVWSYDWWLARTVWHTRLLTAHSDRQLFLPHSGKSRVNLTQAPGPPGSPRCPYLVITPPGVKFPEADRRLEAGPGAQAGRAERTIIGQMFWENENSYNILYLEIFANGQIGPTQILSMTILAVSHSNNTVINIYKRVMMVNHTFKNNWQQIPLTLVCVSISSECLFSFHSLDSRAPESFGIYFWVEFTSNANTLWDIHAYF